MQHKVEYDNRPQPCQDKFFQPSVLSARLHRCISVKVETDLDRTTTAEMVASGSLTAHNQWDRLVNKCTMEKLGVLIAELSRCISVRLRTCDEHAKTPCPANIRPTTGLGHLRRPQKPNRDCGPVITTKYPNRLCR